MNSFLDYIFLENSIRDYLLVLGAILLAVILKKLLSRYIAGLFYRVVQKVTKGVDKETFVNLVISPLQTFLVIMITIIALDKLRFPAVFNFNIYKVTFHVVLEALSIIILIISFVWLLLRIIDFIAVILERKANLAKDLSDNQLIVFFKDFFKVLLVIIGILLVLKYGFSYQISSLITGLSLAGAAIALATRESIENLIASFIIFFDKPFATGDLVKVQHITGTVEKIGLRSTRIRSDQKTFVTVPNKQMVDSIMDNLTLRTQRRGFVQLEISSSTPTDVISQFLLATEGLLQRRKDKIESHTVFLSDITKNAFVVFIEFFAATIPPADFNMLRQQVNLGIIQLMEDMNIRLASQENEMPSEVEKIP